ncbi:AzlC family ABC transporter permease [Clostridium sp. BJN0001]|uniref:AzlC family ABC transporter permease n=1 Tax=Clostridium sp. BJN0001 TaxID=2930219 RepID=UPI001FD053F8|nr:AzlC family ABC transporter permease [Clostridium sp. BJN0001]
MKSNKNNFLEGLHDAVPIAMGYFAVSFTLGIALKKAGITVFESGIMSASNCTSAGEFAAIDIIKNNSSYMEIAFIELIINIRYLLMSCALSQKLEKGIASIHRIFLPFCITDEIFGISILRNGRLSPFYSYGAISIALPAWTLGTTSGVICGQILPLRVVSCLSIALYGMFIAVIIPTAKREKSVLYVVIVSMVLSFLFAYMPYVKNISSGTRILALTIIISFAAAIIHPIADKEKDEEKYEKGEILNEA